jgi:hypothetical protein
MAMAMAMAMAEGLGSAPTLPMPLRLTSPHADSRYAEKVRVQHAETGSVVESWVVSSRG